MGDWPPASFGHFGQSGALLLVNADEAIGVVATSTEPFGPWAVEALARVDECQRTSRPGFVSPDEAARRTRPRRFAGVAGQLDDRPG